MELGCAGGHLHYDCYSGECYYRRCIDLQNLKKNYDSRSIEKQEQQTMTEKMEEAVEFLRYWRFEGEDFRASRTGDATICTSDGSRFPADGLILVSSVVFFFPLEHVLDGIHCILNYVLCHF